MDAQSSQGPWWAALTIWGVVNAVNLLQSAGFLSRVLTGGVAVNHALGYVMMVLAAPAIAAIVGFARAGAGWLELTGPTVYLAFIALMASVEYLFPVEFRSPRSYGILVPYVVLFFAAILFMGLPMFERNRGLWLVTVTTTVFLLASMGVAMRRGVG